MYIMSKLYSEKVMVPEYKIKGENYFNYEENDKVKEWGIRRPRKSINRKKREKFCRKITRYDFIHLSHDEKFIDEFFSPKKFIKRFRVFGVESIHNSTKTKDLKRIVDDYWNMDNKGEEDNEEKPKYKKECVEWIFCKLMKSKKENVFSKKRKRKLELLSIGDLPTEELNFFSFFEGKYIIEKNIMLHVLSFLLQNCRNIVLYSSNITMKRNKHLSLINSRWYVLFLGASGRFHEGKSISYKRLYVLPVIFLNNLQRVHIEISKEFYFQDYRYLQENLRSLKEIRIISKDRKEFYRFFSCVRSSNVTLRCTKMEFLCTEKPRFSLSNWPIVTNFKKFPSNNHLPNLKHVLFNGFNGTFDLGNTLRTVQILEFVSPFNEFRLCPTYVVVSSLDAFPCLKEIRFHNILTYINTGMESFRLLHKLKDLKKIFHMSVGMYHSIMFYKMIRNDYETLSNLSNVQINLKCAGTLTKFPADCFVTTNMMAFRILDFEFMEVDEKWLRTFKNQFFRMGNLEKLRMIFNCLDFVYVDIFKKIELFHSLGKLKKLESLLVKCKNSISSNEDCFQYFSTKDKKIFDITKNSKLKEVSFKRDRVHEGLNFKRVICTYFDHLENWDFKLNRDQKISYKCYDYRHWSPKPVEYVITNEKGKKKVFLQESGGLSTLDFEKIRNTPDQELTTD